MATSDVDILVKSSEGKNPLYFSRRRNEICRLLGYKLVLVIFGRVAPYSERGAQGRFRMTCARAASTCFLGICFELSHKLFF
jgi:hypothetical protein